MTFGLSGVTIEGVAKSTRPPCFAYTFPYSLAESKISLKTGSVNFYYWFLLKREGICSLSADELASLLRARSSLESPIFPLFTIF
jgi:hypothetical protein